MITVQWQKGKTMTDIQNCKYCHNQPKTTIEKSADNTIYKLWCKNCGHYAYAINDYKAAIMMWNLNFGEGEEE